MFFLTGVPPPPENLQITDCYDRAPILSWTPVASNNAPITQYLIYQESNHNPTVFKLVHNVADPNVTSFQLRLNGWTNLRFRVRAVNDFGAGRPSLSTAKGACETPSVGMFSMNVRLVFTIVGVILGVVNYLKRRAIRFSGSVSVVIVSRVSMLVTALSLMRNGLCRSRNGLYALP